MIAADRTLPLVAGLALVLAVLVLPPLWYLLRGSFYTTNALGEPGDFTFRYYLELIQGRGFLGDLVNSLIFAGGSTVLTLLLGGLMAWLVERTNMPGKPLAYIAALVSLGTPYLIYVIAWLFLVGKNGPVNGAIRALTGNPDAGLNIYSMGGMVVVEGCLWSPLAFLLLAPVFRMSNADYEEAARMAGAGLVRTLLLISLRLAAPAFLAIALLSMVRSLEAFEVPILVGEPGGIDILTTEVYLDLAKKVPPDLGQASAFSIALLILTAGLIYGYSRLSRNAAQYQTVTGKGFRPRTIDLGRARYLALVLLILNLTLVLILPMAGLFWLSVMPFSQTVSVHGLQLATMRNYVTVIHSSHYLDLVWTTFVMAAGGATLAMALTTLCAWLGVRRRRFAWILDQLATVPLAFPGIVLGVSLLAMFLSLPIHIYGTIAAFVVAFTIRFLPYGMR
ncbi:MAG: ABC transporter permease, partial [Nevskiales bacterium]